MRRLVIVVFFAAACAVPIVKADVRPLSDAERQALLSVAQTSDVMTEYAEGDGDRWLRYAIVAYRHEPMSDGACIATTVDYMALPGPETRWEPVFDSVAYRYWPKGSECSDLSVPESIRLDTLIDTDTLDRIVNATLRILEKVDAAPRGERRLVAIGVEYSDVDRMFLYRADYASSEACSGIRVHLRARAEIELARVVPTTCETREYLEAIRQ